jgi:hypothetical protein
MDREWMVRLRRSGEDLEQFCWAYSWQHRLSEGEDRDADSEDETIPRAQKVKKKSTGEPSRSASGTQLVRLG